HIEQKRIAKKPRKRVSRKDVLTEISQVTVYPFARPVKHDRSNHLMSHFSRVPSSGEPNNIISNEAPQATTQPDEMDVCSDDDSDKEHSTEGRNERANVETLVTNNDGENNYEAGEEEEDGYDKDHSRDEDDGRDEHCIDDEEDGNIPRSHSCP